MNLWKLWPNLRKISDRRIKLPLNKEKPPKVPAKFNFFKVPDIVS